MAYNITDACVKCGACADNCPVEAISEGDEKYVIDADVCVSCGACADNCPVEAIEEGSSSSGLCAVVSAQALFLSRCQLWNTFTTGLPWISPGDVSL